MERFALVVVALIVLMGASDACGQETDEVKQLKVQIELLEAKLEAANLKIEKLEQENQQLKAGGKTSAPAGRKPSLSERLTAGTVIKGDFITTNMGKDNVRGKATLTVSERKENTFKGTLLATVEGKPDLEHEVTGTITSTGVASKSVSAPNPFTLHGKLRDDYLTLQFSGQFTKATVKLKVE